MTFSQRSGSNPVHRSHKDHSLSPTRDNELQRPSLDCTMSVDRGRIVLSTEIHLALRL